MDDDIQFFLDELTLCYGVLNIDGFVYILSDDPYNPKVYIGKV